MRNYENKVSDTDISHNLPVGGTWAYFKQLQFHLLYMLNATSFTLAI